MQLGLPRLYSFPQITYYLTFFFFALKVLYTAESQQLSYVVSGLKPYSIYNFTISLCNSVGCVTSAPGAGQTLAAGKQVLMDMNYTSRVYTQTPTKLVGFSSGDLIFVFCAFPCSLGNRDCYLP